MKQLQNLHTHSTFSDGKSTPEQLIEKALELGFTSIGFSDHTYMPFDNQYHMPYERITEYKKKLRALKSEYADRIKIYCGLEVDLSTPERFSGFDYLIGSVHCLKIDGEYVDFDTPLPKTEALIEKHFDGDGMRFAEAYYKTLATLPEHGDFDIIGHFDIIAKHIEKKKLFDENSEKYLKYATDAMDKLRGKIEFFEINTGAIGRGYRTLPYPSKILTKELLARGFKPVITTDCHQKELLDCGFDTGIELLRSLGVAEYYILTDVGFRPVKI